MECELLALLQEREAAVGHYRKLLERELDSMADPGFIQDILASFRVFYRPTTRSGRLRPSCLRPSPPGPIHFRSFLLPVSTRMQET